jgi:predicted Zn-dependent protease
MVEIKIDKDKFDERVERIIHNTIGHAFGLKPKPDQQEREQ